jgi:hypothetical protein
MNDVRLRLKKKEKNKKSKKKQKKQKKSKGDQIKQVCIIHDPSKIPTSRIAEIAFPPFS